MPKLHWFPFWRHTRSSQNWASVAATICVAGFLVFSWKMMWDLHIRSLNDLLTSCDGIQQEPGRLMASVELSGGLGNLMFQFAFLYVVAKTHEYQIVLPRTKELEKLKEAFEIDFSPFEKPNWDGKLTEKCFKVIEDDWDCAYDSKIVEKSWKNVHYKGYFQSWKYFVSYEEDLRKMFRFHPHILNEAASILHKALASKLGVFNNTGDRPVLVGVHIRRGDMKNEKIFVDFGYKIADAAYVKTAMTYFRRNYQNIIFIVSSNDVSWAKENIRTAADVFIVEGNTAVMDMAVLSLTNHTIMSVGTFGWWISFLTNGHTVYYKYPFVPGSPLSEQFKGNTDTHLFPQWIGLDGEDKL
ncbi:galactoside 2-alpha-L-fucosyltransferase 2-like [Pecten maximus]|uniref:galactoside 2-alpha-L-fucosyltransferase 2-like n=1 Tax=Pecten maximus TaxID=6579 RepID=UPI0014588AFF|nr:galactoside 2-alpha-L-fucosyltransferase 2-like [Pecten maximus]